MKFIGLLMVAAEDDILQPVLDSHLPNVDCLYALDGTQPNTYSKTVISRTSKCCAYVTDADLPRPPYPDNPVDGYRQFLYELAVSDHGPDNWFLLLHGDEVWDFDPRVLPGERPDADGFFFRLPFFFPHANDGWDDTRGPLEQLHWQLGPGWPELRMFRGAPNVQFDVRQHFNVTPAGLRNVSHTDYVIRHYPFRSPDAQRARALRHVATGFDPDNYRHITGSDAVLWDDDLIQQFQALSNFAEVAHA